MNNMVKGGGIGAVAGGALGGVIGNQVGNTTAGILIGAAVGGAAGAAIGRYMDKQAAEIQKDIEGARVERVGEGIKITFDSGILFDSGSADLKQAAKDNIVELSRVLKKYEDTNIVIQGYTDSKGTEEFNQKLSERRASAVTNFAVSQGVNVVRVTTTGMGEAHPVGDNDSEGGRAQNRRVELAIFANKKLRKAAMAGNQL
jgi:outer membrane protein OmpA-like peptidoglycan-associated protein